MGNDLSKEESKAIGGTVGGATSAATIGTGIGLMFLGPVGMIAGGVLLGTGVSSAVNTVQQCTSDEKFDYGKWGISAGIGAAGGAVAAPFSVAGGMAASALSSTAAKVGTMVAAEAVGSSVSGAYTTVIDKASKGEDVTLGDIGKAMAVGAVAGAVGGSAGQLSSKIASVGTKTVGNVASKSATAVRMGVSAVGGAAGGAGSAALATFVDNALHHGEFKRDKFFAALRSLGADTAIAEKLWTELCNRRIVVNEKVEDPLPDSVHFSEELEPYREVVKALIDASLDLGKGVGEAAAQGAVVGGVCSAITSAAETHQLKKQIKADAKSRAEQVKSGARGGSIEIEAHARKNNERVVVHHDDGSVTKHGSKSAKSEKHIRYDSQKEHYSRADSSGRKLDLPESHKPKSGDCLFDALAQGKSKGKSADTLRHEIADHMSKKPTDLKGLKVKELHQGGAFIGGGKHKSNVSENTFKDASNAIRNCKEPLTSEDRSNLRESADRAIKQVNKVPERSLNKVGSSKSIPLWEQKEGAPRSLESGTAKLGEFNVHSLKGAHKGCIGVDLYNTSGGRSQSDRGDFRLILKESAKGGYEFKGFVVGHKYETWYDSNGVKHTA